MNFNGKNVLITGARGNLGRAVAHAFAQAGARVVLLDRHVAPLPEAGTGHLALQADLLDAGQLGEAVTQAIRAARHRRGVQPGGRLFNGPERA